MRLNNRPAHYVADVYRLYKQNTDPKLQALHMLGEMRSMALTGLVLGRIAAHKPYEVEDFGSGKTSSGSSAGENLAALKADQYLEGETVYLVGPEGSSSTRRIRIADNRVTYDTRAPDTAKKVARDMWAIRNKMGLKFKEGDWWTGTHGKPDGTFGNAEPNYFYRERKIGGREGWNVHHTTELPNGFSLLDGGLERPTVYNWCFSSSCFIMK